MVLVQSKVGLPPTGVTGEDFSRVLTVRGSIQWRSRPRKIL